MPPQVLEPLGLPPLKDALEYVHNPPREAQLVELAAVPASGAAAARVRRAVGAPPQPEVDEAVGADPIRPGRSTMRTRLTAQFLQALPFSLTNAQARVLDEVEADLCTSAARRSPGSGRCRLRQDRRRARLRLRTPPVRAFRPYSWRPRSCSPNSTGATSVSGFIRCICPSHWCPARSLRKVRKSALEAIASGEVRIIVGTHALFQEGIDFAKLGADHRRRAASLRRAAASADCRKKGRKTGPLSASAHHDRDADSANARDDGVCRSRHLRDRRVAAGPHTGQDGRRARRASQTKSLRASRAACREGRQVYWVCPLIEESDEVQAQAAEDTAAALAEALAGSESRPRARAHAAREERRGNARLQGGQDSAARRDHGHRSRRGRTQRDPDGHRECRAHGPRAASPAARPSRARRGGQHLRAALSQPA